MNIENSLWGLIREPLFEDQIGSISANYSRLDELDSAIDWYLCRNPEAEHHLGGSFYIWKTKDSLGPEFPALRIFYFVDSENERVILIEVEEVK